MCVSALCALSQKCWHARVLYFVRGNGERGKLLSMLFHMCEQFIKL